MSTPKPKTGPLTGIRILDLTRLYPGPLGAMLMADMGADVIKIEDINSPDYMRTFPPFVGENSAGYLAVNRSKRSLAIDLRAVQGKKIFFDLVKTADIVVESFRPNRLKKMGLDYEKARTASEKIIYVSVTGYGQDGPYAQKAGHDLNYLGYAGILALTGGKDSGPVIPGVQMADVAGGAYMTVIACLSALWARERSPTRRGQHVDVSMLDSILPLMTLQWAHFQAFG
ncbi:MAG: CaiB/BaiF CoA transferase family protein, partial [bacterium]